MCRIQSREEYQKILDSRNFDMWWKNTLERYPDLTRMEKIAFVARLQNTLFEWDYEAREYKYTEEEAALKALEQARRSTKES